MEIPPYINDFINLIKIQLKYYHADDYYYIYGDYVAAKMTGCHPYNINLFIETKTIAPDKTVALNTLLKTCLDSIKMLYPRHIVMPYIMDRYHSVYEFRGAYGEFLFTFDFKFGTVLGRTPIFEHELLAEDKYNHILALTSNRELNGDQQGKVYNLIQLVHRKELKIVKEQSILRRSLSDQYCKIFMDNATKKLQRGWKVFTREAVPFQQECAICLDKFYREPLVGTQCQHFFHLPCFQKYIIKDENTVENPVTPIFTFLRQQCHKCPICKESIKQLKLTYYHKYNEQKTVLQPLQKYSKSR